MQRRKVKSDFFNRINAVIDWQSLRRLIEPAYVKGFSTTGVIVDASVTGSPVKNP